MNYKLRVLVVEVLSKLVALAAGLTLIYAILYIFPRYVDMRAGRTSFSEVKGYFGLGLSAVVLVGALYMLLLRFSRDVRREREATRTNKRGRSPTVKFPATAAPLPARTQPVYPTKFQSTPHTGLKSGNLCWTATAVVVATAAAQKNCTCTISCRSRAAAPTRWATCARCARVAMRGYTRI